MAMIKCPECGQEISDKAKKCIHCGKVMVEDTSVKDRTKCPECGKLITLDDEVCPNCGCPIEKKGLKSKLQNKLFIIYAAILFIVIICIIIFISINSNPVKKYLHQFNKNNDKEAVAIYNEKILGNKEFEIKLENEQNKMMDDIFTKFKDKKVTYNETVDEIENYIKYVSSKQYAIELKKKIDALNGSRIAYVEAQKAEKDNDIETALKKYKAVVEDDESYTEAQNRINALQESFKTQLLNEAESYVQNKQYKEAITNVNKVISVLGSTEELTELKQQYSLLKSEQYVKISVVDKSVTPEDIENWIYNNYVDFVFEITNNSDKAIKGIEGNLMISDLFGKEILTMGCDFTGNTINSGETYTESALSYKCNKFIDKDMQLFNTEYKDLQFSYDITSIVYEDNSIINPE